MSDETVTAADANRYFSRILRRVRGGGIVTITSHGKPVAQLRPFDEPPQSEPSARTAPRRAALDDLEAHWADLSPVLVGRWTRTSLRIGQR